MLDSVDDVVSKLLESDEGEFVLIDIKEVLLEVELLDSVLLSGEVLDKVDNTVILSDVLLARLLG
jgi:hypothetical protein